MAQAKMWSVTQVSEPYTPADVELRAKQDRALAAALEATQHNSSTAALKERKKRVRRENAAASAAAAAANAGPVDSPMVVGIASPGCADSVLAPSEAETVVVETAYTLRGVKGTAAFEIAAVPLARRRRACSDVSAIEAGDSAAIEGRENRRPVAEKTREA